MAKWVRSASNPWCRRISFWSESASGERQWIVAAARAAHEMDVLGLLGAVILRAALQVRVLKDADLLEQRERPIHGRGVHAGHLALDLPGDDGGRDVALRVHDGAHDGPALWGHP